MDKILAMRLAMHVVYDEDNKVERLSLRSSTNTLSCTLIASGTPYSLADKLWISCVKSRAKVCQCEPGRGGSRKRTKPNRGPLGTPLGSAAVSLEPQRASNIGHHRKRHFP